MEEYYEDEDGVVHLDKNWAHDYILGPLHDLEPNQESATRIRPSSSRPASPTRPSSSRNHPQPPTRHSSKGHHHHQHQSRSSRDSIEPSSVSVRQPSPPPKKAPGNKNKSKSASNRPSLPGRSRSDSVSSSRSSFRLPSPSPSPSQPRNPPSPGGERAKSAATTNNNNNTSYPPITRWNRGTIFARSFSVPVATQSAPVFTTNPGAGAKEERHPRRSSFSFSSSSNSSSNPNPSITSTRPITSTTRGHRRHESLPATMQISQERGGGGGSSKTNTNMNTNTAPEGGNPRSSLRRGNSLGENYPGDMSHRPLDTIKREHRAADRQPRLHTRHRKQPSDLIDSLDLTDPIRHAPYHHEGPYDATMRFRNTNKKYSPLEAVRDSNMEALKATPREYIEDSLTKHVPLRGTAEVPPGMQSFGGQTMQYSEGADLMREPDAAGGAYKRWDGIQYLDGDLKGKGEPSYTLERELRDRRARLDEHLTPRGVAANSNANVYEMQAPGAKGRGPGKSAHVRQRSVSNTAAAEGGSSSRLLYGENDVPGSGSGHGRSDTAGKSKLQGLRSAFGSLRLKRGQGQGQDI